METASRQINDKIGLAAKLLGAFEALEPPPAPAGRGGGRGGAPGAGKIPTLAPAEIQAFRVELGATRTRFGLSTCHLFIAATKGFAAKAAAQESFRQIVVSGDFAGEVDRMVSRLAAYAPPKSPPPPPKIAKAYAEIRALFDQYADGASDPLAVGGVIRIDYNHCPECQAEMVVDADTSELRCSQCAQVRELVGTVFDEAQFYNQEGQKAKSGTFNPNRHCHFWIVRLLAQEAEEELGDRNDPDNLCGEKLLHSLRKIVRQENLILRFLDVDTCRRLLRHPDIKRTELNKNVPLILKKLTGVGPPQLPESVCQRASKLFSMAVEVEEEIRPPGRTNRNYYPYYLYKIFDCILELEDTENRRILYYIYLQSQETLDKNDRDWQTICDRVPELAWAPTVRSAATQKFRPS